MKRTLITFLLFAFVAPAFAEDATYEGEDLEEINVVAEAPAPTRLQIKDVPANIPETINYTPPAQPQQNTTQKSDTSDNDEDNDSNGNGSNNQDLQQLQANSDAAHENETSLKNKLIGAAGIGVTGIGGMMIGEALSEQDADDDIERQMRAYINTFRCEYGNYPAVAGGKTNIELPGGNELFNLYAQYATLSNDLKVRKEALGIKPGIESEVVWDKAETGLYDDVGTGIVAGSYASVARALLLGGADAAAWAAQKNATAEKLQTGIIVAGAGAIGSALANAQLNRHETAKKYSGLKEPAKKLEEAINSAPAPLCSDFTGTDGKGTTLDGCHCVNKAERFFIDGDGCKPCEQSGFVYNEHNECACPFGQTTDENNKCVPVAPSCNLTGDVTAQCSCMSGADQNGTNCTCPYGSDSGKCKELTDIELPTPIYDDIAIIEPDFPEEEVIILNLSLTADNTFELNSWKLSDTSISNLTKFKQDATSAQQVYNFDLQKDNDYCLIIVGKTDRTQYKKGSKMNNQKLSENRANAVKDELIDTFQQNNILAYGIAEQDCDIKKHPNANDANCRRVDIKMVAGSCDDYKPK